MDISKLKAPALTRREKLLAFLPAAAWYAVIFAFSAQTGEESGALSSKVVRGSFGLLGELGELLENDWDVFILLTFLVRKGAHMGIFFVLTALLFYGFWKAGVAVRPGMAAAVGLCALLAGLDEFHQTFVPGRDGKLPDVLVDLAGGICFLLLWWAGTRLYRRRKARSESRTLSDAKT